MEVARPRVVSPESGIDEDRNIVPVQGAAQGRTETIPEYDIHHGQGGPLPRHRGQGLAARCERPEHTIARPLQRLAQIRTDHRIGFGK